MKTTRKMERSFQDSNLIKKFHVLAEEKLDKTGARLQHSP
jgi:hypothetical protein